MQLQSGTLLQGGKYKIEKVLGQGGFGITYLATQELLDRKVCIKEFFFKDYCVRTTDGCVTSSTDGNRDMVTRFLNKFLKEARTISRLSHPNIVSILDIFQENCTAYYVMEYIEGVSLAGKVSQQGALRENKAVDYIRQVGSALDYIHQRRINHLDVKPANIMIRRSDNKAILIDFGVSKQYDIQGGQTSTTPVGISHGYAPMEQYMADGVSTFSPQTDIYALGATLYNLLTATLPPAPHQILTNGISIPSRISFSLAEAIRKAMQPNKNKRPHSIDEFLTLLKAPTSKDDGPTKLIVKETNNENIKGGKDLFLSPSFFLKKILILLLVCVVVAFFVVRTYNNRNADDNRLESIELRRLDSITKVKEAERLAEEAIRLERYRKDSIAKAEETKQLINEVNDNSQNSEELKVEQLIEKIEFYVERSEEYFWGDHKLYAKVNGQKIQVELPEDICIAVESQQDFDGDGITDALVRSIKACGGNGRGDSFFFVKYNQNYNFIVTEEFGVNVWSDATIEDWKGNLSVLIEDEVGAHKYHTKRYIFKDDKVVLVEEVKPGRISAIKEVVSADFEKGKKNEIYLFYDLDNDKVQDKIYATYWQRWDTFHYNITLSCTKLSYESEGAVYRLGVLETQTNGVHDLILNDNNILKWDGQKYISSQRDD